MIHPNTSSTQYSFNRILYCLNRISRQTKAQISPLVAVIRENEGKKLFVFEKANIMVGLIYCIPIDCRLQSLCV